MLTQAANEATASEVADYKENTPSSRLLVRDGEHAYFAELRRCFMVDGTTLLKAVTGPFA